MLSSVTNRELWDLLRNEANRPYKARKEKFPHLLFRSLEIMSGLRSIGYYQVHASRFYLRLAGWTVCIYNREPRPHDGGAKASTVAGILSLVHC